MSNSWYLCLFVRGLVFSALLIRAIRQRVFPAALAWTGTLGILVAGLGVQVPSVLIGVDGPLPLSHNVGVVGRNWKKRSCLRKDSI